MQNKILSKFQDNLNSSDYNSIYIHAININMREDQVWSTRQNQWNKLCNKNQSPEQPL